MKIIDSYAYQGKNIFSYKPVIKLNLDLGDYYNVSTDKIEGFNESLADLLPGLSKHKCSKGYEGGFLERLKEGTYFGHVIEHTAIELQNILGYDIAFGKTLKGENERNYLVIYAYMNEYAGLECGRVALELINSLLGKTDYKLYDEITRLKKKCIDLDFGISTLMIKQEAQKRNIPVIRIGEGSLLQLGYGKNGRRLEATLSDNSSCVSVDVACNKDLAKKIMYEYGIPIPEGKLVKNEEELLKQCMVLGYPVVVKPNFGSHGIGVSINLKTPEEVLHAYKIAKKYEDTILVEKYVKGNHYRLLVVGDRMVAASMRIAAHVVGDGCLTIKELIDKENNTNIKRGEGHEKPLTKIIIDKIVEAYLKKQNLDLDYVPTKGETVYLRENDNLSTGGIAVDVTDKVHCESAAFAVKAAKIIGLDIAGIDITIPDISKPLIESGGAVIEINAAPGIRMHHYPAKGKPRNVAKEIVNYVCPKDKEYRIPIISITGTNGKTTTARMINHILRIMNKSVGATTTDGIYINDDCIKTGDNTGPVSARTVLMDKNVEYAVFETARGGIINKGLGYEVADVGIITNIQEDHLGIDGVYDLDDLTFVKSLVAEAVKPTGYAVLNAEDENCMKIYERVKSKKILFSLKNNKQITDHVNAGGVAFLYNGKSIILRSKNKEQDLIRVEDMSFALGGILEYNIDNALAAASGAYAAGISISDIRKGLETFKCDVKDNPGRFNIFNVNGVEVIIDYGHNIDGYKSVLEALKRIKKNRLIGVIGVPGDRTDSSTIKIGEMCGNCFDKIYIKEDKDKRGRKTGEIAEILKKGCLSGEISPSGIIIELAEDRAFEMAIKSAERDDIIIIFYEEFEPLISLINKMIAPIHKTGLIIA